MRYLETIEDTTDDFQIIQVCHPLNITQTSICLKSQYKKYYVLIIIQLLGVGIEYWDSTLVTQII